MVGDIERKCDGAFRQENRALEDTGRFADGHGLYLQVLSVTNRSWLFRYTRTGRERWMGLGPLHTFPLAEARELARKARQQIKDGTDPLDVNKAAKQAGKLQAAKTKTFKECADDYYTFHEAKWKNPKWRNQFTATLRDYAHPKIGHLPIADIEHRSRTEMRRADLEKLKPQPPTACAAAYRPYWIGRRCAMIAKEKIRRGGGSPRTHPAEGWRVRERTTPRRVTLRRHTGIYGRAASADRDLCAGAGTDDPHGAPYQ